MLVLTRRSGESIQIRDGSGKLIRVTVLRVGEGSVRIGIAAAQDVNIVREELLTRADANTDAGTEPEGA